MRVSALFIALATAASASEAVASSFVTLGQAPVTDTPSIMTIGPGTQYSVITLGDPPVEQTALALPEDDAVVPMPELSYPEPGGLPARVTDRERDASMPRLASRRAAAERLQERQQADRAMQAEDDIITLSPSVIALGTPYPAVAQEKVAAIGPTERKAAPVPFKLPTVIRGGAVGDTALRPSADAGGADVGRSTPPQSTVSLPTKEKPGPRPPAPKDPPKPAPAVPEPPTRRPE